METGDGDDGLTKSEDSVKSESALAWAEKYCKQTSMFLDPYVGRRLGFALHNSSHPCYRRTRERVLLGYLKRRYKLSGKSEGLLYTFPSFLLRTYLFCFD